MEAGDGRVIPDGISLGRMQGKDPFNEPEKREERQGDEIDHHRYRQNQDAGPAEPWNSRRRRSLRERRIGLFDVLFHERFSRAAHKVPGHERIVWEFNMRKR